MILLGSTTDVLRVVTGSAVALDVVASYVDLDAGGLFSQVPVPANDGTLISTAATTTIVAAPTGTNKRTIKSVSLYNRDASASDLVTVQLFDGTSAYVIVKTTLLAGETLCYDEGDGWSTIDSSGRLKSIVTTPGQYVGSTLVTSASANFTTGARTNSIRVRGVGGGGAGGGCTSVAASAAGAGGGGAGGYAEKTLAVSPGTAYAYTCGAAGAGSSGAAGGNGGDSTFVVGGTTVTAKGGTGGPQAVAITTLKDFLGGAGGVVGTNGDVNAPGECGQPGNTLIVATPIGLGGQGGSGPFGSGGAATITAGAGVAALGNGAGGGGSMTGASAARAGGNGTAGCWLIEEYT